MTIAMPDKAARYELVVDLSPAACRMGFRFDGEVLVAADYLDGAYPLLAPVGVAPQALVAALYAYAGDARSGFDIAISLAGSDFQRRVWQALCEIPAGATRSYGELAAKLGSSARAVGNACRRNPIPLIVPCHRVVSASGLGGFMGQRGGWEISIKQRLLEHERIADGC